MAQAQRHFGEAVRLLASAGAYTDLLRVVGNLGHLDATPASAAQGVWLGLVLQAPAEAIANAAWPLMERIPANHVLAPALGLAVFGAVMTMPMGHPQRDQMQVVAEDLVAQVAKAMGMTEEQIGQWVRHMMRKPEQWRPTLLPGLKPWRVTSGCSTAQT